MKMRRFHGVAGFIGLVAALAAGAGSAWSQGYPERPITLVCPYGPGTGIDLIARILAQRLGEEYGQPVVVRNQPGASGNIGADVAAKAAPDGYTIVILANSQIINQHISKNVRDVQKDFVAVAPAGTLPYLLGVPSQFPAKSIREVVAVAKSKPGEINYGTVPASLPHFLGVMLKSSADIDIRLVPYKSTTDAIGDVLSGRVPLWFTTVATALPLVNSGKVRALGVTGEKRAAVLPDVPTMTEAGFPALDISQSFFYLAPAGTPPAIVAKLNADITRAMGNKDVREKLANQGVEPATSTPEQLAALLRSEYVKWGRIVKESGIRTE